MPRGGMGVGEGWRLVLGSIRSSCEAVQMDLVVKQRNVLYCWYGARQQAHFEVVGAEAERGRE